MDLEQYGQLVFTFIALMKPINPFSAHAVWRPWDESLIIFFYHITQDTSSPIRLDSELSVIYNFGICTSSRWVSVIPVCTINDDLEINKSQQKALPYDRQWVVHWSLAHIHIRSCVACYPVNVTIIMSFLMLLLLCKNRHISFLLVCRKRWQKTDART